MRDYDITYKNVYGHYEIYVDGEMYCTCEINELEDEIKEIKNVLQMES